MLALLQAQPRRLLWPCSPLKFPTLNLHLHRLLPLGQDQDLLQEQQRQDLLPHLHRLQQQGQLQEHLVDPEQWW